ncbi:Dcp2, box A domain-containing protein [Cryptosporidium muris RN66]|uniref:Dcp2, box A domain-containing protein n=1 Tax=Cryptosporidium muris (strain RN66) TaxID=441375 RepID=B6AFV3_CRYMR|nr:Dcp2, box A domain-containing protein [Cryptosporidium muris RN66]EEA07094.1 Dcp2, box A domain-containing protein [Cryptosporidium muris RN66]|eukprot:XP_002141443.1 Dcp2, box A domain-containing protein [Cryptosporidium muris RN66]
MERLIQSIAQVVARQDEQRSASEGFTLRTGPPYNLNQSALSNKNLNFVRIQCPYLSGNQFRSSNNLYYHPQTTSNLPLVGNQKFVHKQPVEVSDTRKVEELSNLNFQSNELGSLTGYNNGIDVCRSISKVVNTNTTTEPSKYSSIPSRDFQQKRTASIIAAKYLTDDIMLSKVRGLFIKRYTRTTSIEDRPIYISGTDKKISIYKDPKAEEAHRDIEAAFSEAICDCYSRFFTNLPVNILEDAIHLYFQIQAAYWWYEDMWYDKYPHVLPKLSLRVFGQFTVEDCPILRHFVSSQEEHDKFLQNWRRYCRTIPLRGVILVNTELTKCVLVKPWNGNRFMFPRGKMDEMEEDSLCAIREAYEELGIDVSNHLHDALYIEKQVDEQTIKLFVIPGIDENTILEPKKRKEIAEIRWFNFTSLPGWQEEGSFGRQKKSKNTNQNNGLDSTGEYTSDNEKDELRGSDDECMLLQSTSNFGLNNGNSGSEENVLFFRVGQFSKNLRGWIEVLRRIPLQSPDNIGGVIPQLPKNLNPAVIRRLQNADLRGPPLFALPLFVRVRGRIHDRKDQPPTTLNNNSKGKKSRPSFYDQTSRDKRTFGTKAGSGWDVEAMFALNEEKFGVKSTFSFDDYTIPLPKSKAKETLVQTTIKEEE